MPSPLATLTLLARDSRIVAAQEQEPVAQSQTSSDQAPADGQEDKPQTPFSPLFLFVMLGLAFWLIVMRPGGREKRERQRKLDTIKKGDRVISIGGIHGKVSDVDHKGGIVTVEVAPKTPIKFSKAAIQTVDPRGAEKSEAKTGE